VAHDLRIVDILHDNPAGVHIQDLAERCKVDPRKLIHIMRMLTVGGIFTEGTHFILCSGHSNQCWM
jgi:DNA-binding Lrp family transcriptional regulator